MSKRKGVRAFVVSVDDYGSEVVYAETAGQARARGMTEQDFTSRQVRRAPELDQFLAKGGPNIADLLQYGWYYECHYTQAEPLQGCYEHVTAEKGGVHNGSPYCPKHLAIVRGIDAALVMDRLATLLVELGYFDPGTVTAESSLGWANRNALKVRDELQDAFGIEIPDHMAPEIAEYRLVDLAAYIALQQAGESREEEEQTA
jgi:hypothetical protein